MTLRHVPRHAPCSLTPLRKVPLLSAHDFDPAHHHYLSTFHSSFHSPEWFSAMESFVPKDSPLDDYLQGSCVLRRVRIHRDCILTRFTFSGVGEREDNWPAAETNCESENEVPATDFAPRGASRFQSRVRNKLPKPLNLGNSPHGAIAQKLYTACSV